MELVAVFQFNVGDSLETPEKVQVPVAPPEFTVGDGVEPGGLLFFDEPGDLLIFHLLQVQGGNLAPGKTVPGLFDPVRTQETSYNIKTKWCLQSHF